MLRSANWQWSSKNRLESLIITGTTIFSWCFTVSNSIFESQHYWKDKKMLWFWLKIALAFDSQHIPFELQIKSSLVLINFRDPKAQKISKNYRSIRAKKECWDSKIEFETVWQPCQDETSTEYRCASDNQWFQTVFGWSLSICTSQHVETSENSGCALSYRESVKIQSL